jgi:hypothetical protein
MGKCRALLANGAAGPRDGGGRAPRRPEKIFTIPLAQFKRFAYCPVNSEPTGKNMQTKTPTARQNLDGLVAIILDETASEFEKQCARQNISCFSEQERKEAFDAAKRTKPTHSPGPWIVDDKHVHCAKGFVNPAIESDVVVEVNTDCHTGGLLTETDKANLRLVAASPDLLDALKAMLDAFPPPKIRASNGFDGNLAHATARAAIAKTEAA